jgi:hypothetical protein
MPIGDNNSSQQGNTIETHQQVGGTDGMGNRIETMYACTKHYEIFESAGVTRYRLPENFDVAKQLRSKVADFGGLRASIEDLKSRSAISVAERLRAGREIAWVLEQAFDTDSPPSSTQAKELLTSIDARLRTLAKSHVRKRYLEANLFAFIAVELLLISSALLLWWKEDDFIGNAMALYRYGIYGAFGALGAFLSVITGIRSIDFDIDLKTWEHAFAGVTRILIGVIGAIVMGLALDSHLIDPTFGRPVTVSRQPVEFDQTLALRCILTFVAGFSETLVPSLLRKAEKSSGADDQQKTPPASNAPIVKSSAQ